MPILIRGSVAITKLSFYSLLTIFILSVSGCATLSKNECLEANWFEIGHKDGINGKPRSIFQKHMDACLAYGIDPDREAYYIGRDEGLRIYCTENNGFNQGKSGRSYRYVCPPELEPGFLAAYNEGKKIYEYESKVSSLERQLKKIDKQIREQETYLHSPNLSEAEKRRVRAHIASLHLEYKDVTRQLVLLAKTKPF